MSTTPVDAQAVLPQQVIHFAYSFRRGAPVLCRSTDLNTSATDEARYVTCGACYPLMTEAQRAERDEQVRRWPSDGGGA